MPLVGMRRACCQLSSATFLLPVAAASVVARVDQTTHAITMIAESPVSIGPGGDILNGRIYFGSGSHVYSYGL